MEPQEIIFIFYDIGGGTFDVDEKIRQNIPILEEINTLIFLISLPQLISESRGGFSVVQQMHKLLNTIVLAIGALGLKKKKNILICFTMGDEMWNSDDHRYGQLTIPIDHQMPCPDGLCDYFSIFGSDSAIIEQHIQEDYTPFYNAIVNNFRCMRFTSISALGSNPTAEGIIANLSPTNIFDPILCLLKLEGYL